MRSSCLLLAVLLFPIFSPGAVPGDKRTILTSGEKVHTIRYQLGQSTILYFGARPETVICGNKNYFAIEKIKEGITIQPLGSFSTNLTVMNRGKRFLFYLTPAKGREADTFVDVRWVPHDETTLVPSTKAEMKEAVRLLAGRLRVETLDLKLLRAIRIESAKRSIIEFEIRNVGRRMVRSSDVQLLLMKAGRPVANQVTVFEQDEISIGSRSLGRLILTSSDLKSASLVISYLGKSSKIQMQAGSH